MATAILVAEPTAYSGPSKTFRIEPSLYDPVSRKIYDCVTVCKTTLGGARVEVYGSLDTGAAVSMAPLPGSFVLQHDVSVDDACVWALMTAGGYEILEAEDVGN